VRIVLDINVLVSAAIARGGPAHALMYLVPAAELQVVISDGMLATLSGVLARPKFARHIGSEARQAFNDLVERISVVVTPDPGVQGIAEDAEDDGVLGTAVAGNAEYLVTGDRWLLEIGEYRGVTIVTPRQFLSILEPDPGPEKQTIQ
jgi:putative PIN family toxin of toxin-antitoxin system